MFPKTCCNMFQPGSRHNIYQRRNYNFAAAAALACRCFWLFNGILSKFGVRYKAIPHNSKCRYGERGAAAAKPKAQIILDVLSSILATQMPCRSRRSGARAVRRELCGIALTFCGYISCTAGCSPRPRRVRAGKQAVRRGLPLVPGIFKNFIPLAANSQGLGRGIKIHSFAS